MGTKQLDSPWATLILDKSPKPNVKAVFIWNERQFYLDELVKCGWHVSDSQPLLPIDLKTFDRWQRDRGGWKRADYLKQLPADIWLLFTTNQIGKLLPDGTEGREQMEKLKWIARKEKIGYIDLNKTLIDRLFTSDRTEIHYNSVLDLKDVLKVDKYRISPSGKCETESEWIKHLIHDSGK